MIIKSSLFLTALTLVSLALYYPGLDGPFVFDDLTSITQNNLLQLTQLDSSSLFNVATSGEAGPLKRPVAMLSFALNYYFSNGYEATSFKLTNVVIHGINAGLVFILLLQILKLNPTHERSKVLFCAGVSLIWCIHPINLTSVLYIVQRMTSLSALFSLGCIILYIFARKQCLNNRVNWLSLLLFTGSGLSLILALFSKENALLVPLFILLIEWLLFAEQAPWQQFKQLTSKQRTLIWATFSTFSIGALIWAIGYADTGFTSRPFSMHERLLTESRVICFYLLLIFLPRINEFGLFHDDIPVSTSFLEPWTTVTSILFITALIASAIYFRKKKPLFTFGVFWFFIGHLLESTIFALEIAHEHRNYLPSIGIILAAASFIPLKTISPNKRLAFFAIISLLLGSITYLRASQWSSYQSLAYHEATHHPKSPASQALLSNAALRAGKISTAIAASKQAMLLAPNEPAHAMNYQQNLSIAKKDAPRLIQEKTLLSLKANKPTAFTKFTLDSIASCLKTPACKRVQHNYLEWINIIIENNPKIAYYHYLKGRAQLALSNELQALNTFQHAYFLDKKFIHPLFEIANIFLRNGQLSQVEKLIITMDATNKIAVYKRDKELQQLKDLIHKIRKDQQVKLQNQTFQRL